MNKSSWGPSLFPASWLQQWLPCTKAIGPWVAFVGEQGKHHSPPQLHHWEREDEQNKCMQAHTHTHEHMHTHTCFLFIKMIFLHAPSKWHLHFCFAFLWHLISISFYLPSTHSFLPFWTVSRTLQPDLWNSLTGKAWALSKCHISLAWCIGCRRELLTSLVRGGKKSRKYFLDASWRCCDDADYSCLGLLWLIAGAIIWYSVHCHSFGELSLAIRDTEQKDS